MKTLIDKRIYEEKSRKILYFSRLDIINKEPKSLDFVNLSPKIELRASMNLLLT